MELLETQDPEKKRLIETSDRHKRALEKEVNELSKKTERMVTNALIIGGSLALTYFLVSSLSGKKKKRKHKAVQAQAEGGAVIETEEEADEPSVLGQLGTKILNQATIMLLDIAKDKLFEYLESRKKADEHS
ncbi:MAG: hypothetical protein U0289_00395 [Cyclobacteriaceae bacterium]|jgi:hypothetical protein|nr:hypothetical protein [Cytophagales bacterium]HNP76455.1 hypothetical protein [Cyclobacteriaceae bacterium]HQQ81569.1 hypothetical protein [Cyclobacteriaceae bacterium]